MANSLSLPFVSSSSVTNIVAAVSKPISVLHIITGLKCGGAEMMLYKLLSAMPQRNYQSHVIVLRPGGMIQEKITNLGIPVLSPRMNWTLPTPRSLLELCKQARKIRPQIIQGWMYHGNLAALVAASSLSYSCPVIWNIRATLEGMRDEKFMSRLIPVVGATFSKKPDQLIYNSFIAKAQHEARGYSDSRAVVIPNGIDCSLFAPNDQVHKLVRLELGIPDSAFVIVHIARYHSMKAHDVMLQAAELFSQRYPSTHFVLVGEQVDVKNSDLVKLGVRLLKNNCLHLLGERSDVERILAASDLATLCSTTEAFPNVVGEAMASGVPCVVTDVGDCAQIVGNTGEVVPVADPQALANGWERFIQMSRQERITASIAARERILSRYSLAAIVERYSALYQNILKVEGHEK